ncbi:3-carboxyethylcatechol 2,3-dioxygenase [Sphingobium lactosutens]|uniref:DODA-type extradiol aromatic ring-opening family dioxygenase n=1 Tax=Sphingobium lactosutens TaxID=522773 RepID=UPI0015C0B1B1|nr:3-carboxyethylcatechol 2,3-dioxygenase [Sphingobium lactosutens]NWK97471.1 3-carboxyethylcatechol 2,3-dioxygenase [Sphingobium lactosutens]
MGVELLCTSHSPLINVDGQAPAEPTSRVDDLFGTLAGDLATRPPKFVIQFGNDHNSGMALKLMPPFMVALRARAVGDFDTSQGPMLVDEATGRALVKYLHGAGVDVATSYDAYLDHGFVVAQDRLFGGIDKIPVIPIFINCGGDLRTPLDRVLALGTAVGEFIRREHAADDVLILGSGGLSHDPPLPDFMTSDGIMQQRMIDGTQWTAQSLRERTERVSEMGREHALNGGGLQALNPGWDRMILQHLAAGRLEDIAAMDDAEVVRLGGRGASEIRNWLAAFAALRAVRGSYSAEELYYEAVPAWIVGFAAMRARACIA